MIIIKNSFYDFLAARDLSIYAEMARPDTKFKGSDDSHSVSSRTPIFTDEYDIMYLYQFPPAFWAAAMAARYNRFLYEAKVKGDEYNDKQDVALPGGGGTTVIFKNRNTFAKHLVDKIQRDVDVNFFRKHGKEIHDIEKHNKEAEEHRKAGRDLGGHIGASLEDPVPIKQKISSRPVKSTGAMKDKYEDIWRAKGFTPILQNSMSARLKAWQEASSEGWLRPLDDSHKMLSYNSRGGMGRTAGDEKKVKKEASVRSYHSFTGDNLKDIHDRMHTLGANQFRLDDDSLADGLVSWPDVTIRQNKTGREVSYSSFTGDKGINGDKKGKPSSAGEPLPVLFDGTAIHSHDVDAYKSAKKSLEQLQNVEQKDIEAMQDPNLINNINKLREEISRKDTQNTWEINPDTDESKERLSAVQKLSYMESLLKIRNLVNAKFPNQQINLRNVQAVLPTLTKDIRSEMESIKKNARRYKEHHWNTHEYNQDREPHDPLGVGMENPTAIGKQKYEALTDRTRGFGVLWPNRNSKHMMHGEEGEWENKYQDKFGAGKRATHLSKEDSEKLHDQANIYLNRIGQKLANDKESLEYLGLDSRGHRPDLVQKLTNPQSIRGLIQTNHPDVKFNSKNRIDGGDVPDLLSKAYDEMLDTWENINSINKEAESSSYTSAINNAITKALPIINSESPAVAAAIENMRDLVAYNAENYIRRTIGHSAWKDYEEKQAGGDVVAKHKSALNLRSFIESKAYSYATLIAQLKMGDDIQTRRIRKSRKGKTNTLSRDSEDRTYDLGSDAMQSRIQARADDQNPPAKKWNDFGKGQYKPGANRSIHSDSLSGVVGSNVDVMYKMAISDLAVKKAKSRMGDVTSKEEEMVHGMSTSVAYFFLMKNEYLDEMKEKGMTVTDDDANKVAHQRSIAHFKQNKWISPDYDQQTAQQPGIAASQGGTSLPDVDRKVSKDEAERIRQMALSRGVKQSDLANVSQHPQAQPEAEPTPLLPAGQQQPQQPNKPVPVSMGLAGRIRRPQPPQQ